MADLLDLKAARWSVKPVLTVKEVAKEADLSPGTILDIEVGKLQDPATVEKAVQAALRLAAHKPKRKGVSDDNGLQVPRSIRR